MGETLLSIKQAADFLGISRKTLYRYDEQGILKPLRMPSGHRRYRKSDLEEFARKMELGGLQRWKRYGSAK